MTRWRDLKAGDWIVCPVSGLTEQVTYSRCYTPRRWSVRTSRHDHHRPADADATLTTKPPEEQNQ